MYELYPYFTNDGSVGLYSPLDNDIYHSAYGARTEAYEKFILPANILEKWVSKTELNVLDICFGIGYNTKSFLNLILNFENSKNLKNKIKILSECNYKIYTNNITTNNNNELIYTNNKFLNESKYISNDKIYSDKIFNLLSAHDTAIKHNNKKIFIKAIDNDKILPLISPFINSKKNSYFKTQKLPFENEKIYKITQEKLKNELKYSKFYNKLINDKYSPIIDILLLKSILASNNKLYNTQEITSIINNTNYKEYFNADIMLLFEFYQNYKGKNTPRFDLNGFLHNIYYMYISICHKKGLKWLKSLNIDFELKINDARKELLTDNNTYDYIFLDAFTPAKCPCLWTYEFLKVLFEHLNNEGILLTYSTAAPVRNALISCGFYIGNIINFSNNSVIGTICSKNKSNINYALSEFDLNLLKTKAGIFYRDENFNAQNEQILKARETEVKNSPLISTTQFKKNFNNNLQFCNNSRIDI